MQQFRKSYMEVEFGRSSNGATEHHLYPVLEIFPR